MVVEQCLRLRSPYYIVHSMFNRVYSVFEEVQEQQVDSSEFVVPSVIDRHQLVDLLQSPIDKCCTYVEVSVTFFFAI